VRVVAASASSVVCDATRRILIELRTYKTTTIAATAGMGIIGDLRQRGIEERSWAQTVVMGKFAQDIEAGSPLIRELDRAFGSVRQPKPA